MPEDFDVHAVDKGKNTIEQALANTPNDGQSIFQLSSDQAPGNVHLVYKKGSDPKFSGGLSGHYHLVMKSTNPEEAKAAEAFLQPFSDAWHELGRTDLNVQKSEVAGEVFHSVVLADHVIDTPSKDVALDVCDAVNKSPDHQGINAVNAYKEELRSTEKVKNWPKDDRGVPLVAVLATTGVYGKEQVDAIRTVDGQCNTGNLINHQVSLLKNAAYEGSEHIPDFALNTQEVHQFLHDRLGIGQFGGDADALKRIDREDLSRLHPSVQIVYDPNTYSDLTEHVGTNGEYRKDLEKTLKVEDTDLSPSVFLVMPLDQLMHEVATEQVARIEETLNDPSLDDDTRSMCSDLLAQNKQFLKQDVGVPVSHDRTQQLESAVNQWNDQIKNSTDVEPKEVHKMYAILSEDVIELDWGDLTEMEEQEAGSCAKLSSPDHSPRSGSPSPDGRGRQ